MTRLQTTIVSMLLALNCSCHPYAFDQPQELVADRNITGSDFEASFVITLPKRGLQADHDGCEIGDLPRAPMTYPIPWILFRACLVSRYAR
jgi:hypothetical protein